MTAKAKESIVGRSSSFSDESRQLLKQLAGNTDVMGVANHDLNIKILHYRNWRHLLDPYKIAPLWGNLTLAY